MDGTQIQLTSGENLLLAQLPNGTSLQFDFNKRVGIEINADGSLYQKDLNSGQIVSKSADGVSVTTFPNGVTITSYPDGRQVQFQPEGGTTLETRPDGSRLQTNADGTTIEFTVDGYRIDKDKDGNIINKIVVNEEKQKAAKAAASLEEDIVENLNATTSGKGGKRKRKRKKSKAGDEEDSLSEDMVEAEEISGESTSDANYKYDDDFEDLDSTSSLNYTNKQVVSDTLTEAAPSGPSLAAQGLDKSSKGARADAVVVSGSVRVPAQFAPEHLRSLKKLLADIPYQLGLLTTAEQVEMFANGDGTLGYDLVLNREEALDMHVVKEVEAELRSLFGNRERLYEALKRTLAAEGSALTPPLRAADVGGEVLAVRLPPTNTDRKWITDPLPLDATQQQQEQDPKADADSGASPLAATTSADLGVTTNVTPKFKTLRGSVRLRGMTPSEFNMSGMMHEVLTTLLQDTILMSVQIKRSLMRVSITHVDDAKGSHRTPRINVHYRIRLRGAAHQAASQAVEALKNTFSDRTQRKSFLATFNSKCGIKDEKLPRVHSKKHRKHHRRRTSSNKASESAAVDSAKDPTVASTAVE